MNCSMNRLATVECIIMRSLRCELALLDNWPDGGVRDTLVRFELLEGPHLHGTHSSESKSSDVKSVLTGSAYPQTIPPRF